MTDSHVTQEYHEWRMIPKKNLATRYVQGLGWITIDFREREVLINDKVAWSKWRGHSLETICLDVNNLIQNWEYLNTFKKQEG